jgi:carbonic anhydrase
VPGGPTFADEVAANAEYARGFALGGLTSAPARRLAVLTCMDTRIDPLRILGLAPGDAVILRNAGARVNDDIHATLVVAQHLLGVERLLVLAHTNCRTTTDDPAALLREIEAAGGPDTSGLALATSRDPAVSVRADVERVRTSELHHGLGVGGFVYAVETGLITQVC